MPVRSIPSDESGPTCSTSPGLKSTRPPLIGTVTSASKIHAASVMSARTVPSTDASGSNAPRPPRAGRAGVSRRQPDRLDVRPFEAQLADADVGATAGRCVGRRGAGARA
jgi:hypothetical protein